MSIYALKPRFQALLRPLAAALAHSGVTANQATIATAAIYIAIGASRRYEGPFGKSDRAFAFGALGLWVGLGGTLPDWLAMALPLFAALLLVTIMNGAQRALVEATKIVR